MGTGAALITERVMVSETRFRGMDIRITKRGIPTALRRVAVHPDCSRISAHSLLGRRHLRKIQLPRWFFIVTIWVFSFSVAFFFSRNTLSTDSSEFCAEEEEALRGKEPYTRLSCILTMVSSSRLT